MKLLTDPALLERNAVRLREAATMHDPPCTECTFLLAFAEYLEESAKAMREGRIPGIPVR